MEFNVQLHVEASMLVQGITADSHEEALTYAMRRVRTAPASTSANPITPISAVITPLDGNGHPMVGLTHTVEPREFSVIQEAVSMVEIMKGLTASMRQGKGGELTIDPENVFYRQAMQSLDRMQELSREPESDEQQMLSLPMGM